MEHFGSLISSLSSKKQNTIQSKLKNKTLSIIAIILSITAITAGIYGIKLNGIIIISIIVIMYFVYAFVDGLNEILLESYLGHFTNAKIDTKIFAIANLIKAIFSIISGLFASFLLDKVSTAYCMIIIGSIFTILYIMMSKYMKKRVGLKPEQYSEIERKYDEQ